MVGSSRLLRVAFTWHILACLLGTAQRGVAKVVQELGSGQVPYHPPQSPPHPLLPETQYTLKGYVATPFPDATGGPDGKINSLALHKEINEKLDKLRKNTGMELSPDADDVEKARGDGTTPAPTMSEEQENDHMRDKREAMSDEMNEKADVKRTQNIFRVSRMMRQKVKKLGEKTTLAIQQVQKKHMDEANEVQEKRWQGIREEKIEIQKESTLKVKAQNLTKKDFEREEKFAQKRAKEARSKSVAQLKNEDLSQLNATARKEKVEKMEEKQAEQVMPWNVCMHMSDEQCDKTIHANAEKAAKSGVNEEKEKKAQKEQDEKRRIQMKGEDPKLKAVPKELRTKLHKAMKSENPTALKYVRSQIREHEERGAKVAAAGSGSGSAATDTATSAAAFANDMLSKGSGRTSSSSVTPFDDDHSPSRSAAHSPTAKAEEEFNQIQNDRSEHEADENRTEASGRNETTVQPAVGMLDDNSTTVLPPEKNNTSSAERPEVPEADNSTEADNLTLTRVPKPAGWDDSSTENGTDVDLPGVAASVTLDNVVADDFNGDDTALQSFSVAMASCLGLADPSKITNVVAESTAATTTPHRQLLLAAVAAAQVNFTVKVGNDTSSAVLKEIQTAATDGALQKEIVAAAPEGSPLASATVDVVATVAALVARRKPVVTHQHKKRVHTPAINASTAHGYSAACGYRCAANEICINNSTCVAPDNHQFHSVVHVNLTAVRAHHTEVGEWEGGTPADIREPQQIGAEATMALAGVGFDLGG